MNQLSPINLHHTTTYHSQARFMLEAGQLATQLKKAIDGRSFLIVTDTNTWRAVNKWVEPLLPPNPNLIVIDSGEIHKNWLTIEKILHQAFVYQLDRDSVFVSLGGGVTGDMVGFAASIFLRGVSYLQIPTTLLAMVDASVGGKTGIDNKFGKNLLGSFHFPEQVLICAEFLSSLPLLHWQEGIAEMIKHGIALSAEHFANLRSLSLSLNDHDVTKSLATLFPLVADSVALKAKIVNADGREKNQRQKLNLGHTFGHAIELGTGFRISHGQAVAMGCVLAAQTASGLGLCSPDVVREIEDLLQSFALPITSPLSVKELWPLMQHDKKRHQQTLHFVLPTQIGEVTIFPCDKLSILLGKT